MRPAANLLSDTMRGVGLLTRLPVAARWFDGFDGRYDRAAGAFPLVGLLLALPIALACTAAAWFGLGQSLVGFIGVAMLIGLTGALHEDGLADTADGLGGRTPEHRLAIMRDSSIGTYGVLALIVSTGVRALALGQVFAAPVTGTASLVASLAVPRAAMAWLWWRTPPARPDGAAAASGRPTRSAVRTAAAITAVLLLPTALTIGPWHVLLALALVAVVVGACRRHAMRSLGGHTGDVLGACVVTSECAVLLALAVGIRVPDMPLP